MKYKGKNRYIRECEISAATKVTILSQIHAASRERNIELLILAIVSDLIVNSLLKNAQRYFYEMHKMS